MNLLTGTGYCCGNIQSPSSTPGHRLDDRHDAGSDLAAVCRGGGDGNSGLRYDGHLAGLIDSAYGEVAGGPGHVLVVAFVGVMIALSCVVLPTAMLSLAHTS